MQMGSTHRMKPQQRDRDEAAKVEHDRKGGGCDRNGPIEGERLGDCPFELPEEPRAEGNSDGNGDYSL